jgi:hypothetical protein
MKKNKTNLFIIMSLWFLTSCDTQVSKTIKNNLYSIDVNQSIKQVDIKLSDLANNFELIQLENKKDILISGSNLYVSDKYIICFDQNGILKFTPQGNFINRIASIGRGPQEISKFATYYIDEIRDRMYIDDMRFRTKFLVYDLTNNRFIEPLKKAQHGMWCSFAVINDSTIIGTTNNHLFDKSEPFALFYQNMKGELVKTIRHSKKLLCGQKQSVNYQASRFSTGDKESHISFGYNDSLFIIKDNKLAPYLALHFQTPRYNPPSSIVKKGKRGVQFPKYENKNFLITRVTTITDVIKTKNGAEKYKRKFQYLLFNKANGKSAQIKSYTDNFIGQSQILKGQKFKFPIQFPNNKLGVVYPAHQIKEAIENGELQKQFSPKLYKRLLEINQNLNDMDNPIILVGKNKNLTIL